MKLLNIDRRLIFLFILVGVIIPLLIPIGFKIEITKNVKMVFDLVQKTKEDAPVLMAFDYDPSTKPELHPMAIAMIKHAIEKKQKVVCVALWPMGSQMCDQIFTILSAEMPSLKYGENFINLGYKAGGIVTIQAMGQKFSTVFPTDANGKKISEFPIMKNITKLKDFSYIASFSAGTPGLKEWIMVAKDKYNIPVTGGTTAVSTPGFLPYINDQLQLHGLIGGLKNAAEYEALVNRKGTATSGMDAQSVAHLIIITFIIIGNIAYFTRKSKKEGK